MQRKILAPALEEEQYIQYIAFSQWDALHGHAKNSVSGSSGTSPSILHMRARMSGPTGTCSGSIGTGDPTAVAGVPPDYFSKTGQLWGNPVYRWEEIERQDFSWWVDRVEHLLRSVTVSGSIISGDCRPAGRSLPGQRLPGGVLGQGPGQALLSRLAARFPSLPLIAEDLGTITPDVRELMATFGIPGMRVLQFGFDGDPNNPHAPAAIGEDVVLYTGTHDNNTVRGWFETEDRAGGKRADRGGSWESAVFPGRSPGT